MNETRERMLANELFRLVNARHPLEAEIIAEHPYWLREAKRLLGKFDTAQRIREGE